MELSSFKNTLLNLFAEAYSGPQHSYTWFIDNQPGSGLLGTLERISAEKASAPHQGSTIAAHSEHLRWSLALTNAFARGEQPKINWSESWSLKTADTKAWDKLRTDLKNEFETLYTNLQRQNDFSDEKMLTSIVALIPHAAYHLGAIRQMAKALSNVS